MSLGHMEQKQYSPSACDRCAPAMPAKLANFPGRKNSKLQPMDSIPSTLH